jgi:hypothetical protein
MAGSSGEDFERLEEICTYLDDNLLQRLENYAGKRIVGINVSQDGNVFDKDLPGSEDFELEMGDKIIELYGARILSNYQDSDLTGLLCSLMVDNEPKLKSVGFSDGYEFKMHIDVTEFIVHAYGVLISDNIEG